jgi:protein-tyrosine-phosphatase
MHIHFVCRGNIYRSRLAEAYAKSLTQDEDVEVSSSGIEADLALSSDVNPYTRDLLVAESNDRHLKPSWTQSTQEHIDTADVVVFMSPTVYEGANKFLEIPVDKARVWHIPDKNGIYPRIKEQVDILLKEVL